MATKDYFHCRADPLEVDIVERASVVAALTKSDFIKRATLREAEDVLLHHNIIKADPVKFDAFAALLDAPVMENENLTKTLRSKPLWDQ